MGRRGGAARRRPRSALKWYVHRLEERRPDGEREPAKLRRRETAIVITIIIGFAAQRFLMEIVAGKRDDGTLSRYERRVLIR